MVDRSAMFLGKKPAVATPELPAMATYAAVAELPQPPANVTWNDNIPWTMLGNDVAGDCTCAAAVHYMQAVERWRYGAARIPTEAETLEAYTALTGYDPAIPATDQGALIKDMLGYWLNTGFSIFETNNKILALVRIDPKNKLHMKQAMWIFGPLILGVLLPLSAQGQETWQMPGDLTGDNKPNSWGGHCVLGVSLDAEETLSVVSWGEVIPAEAGWIDAYCDEAWAVLSLTWQGWEITPSGFSASELIADSRRLS